MRSACGHARRRPRRLFSSVTADASLHSAPSSGLSGLSLAEASRKVQEGDVRPSELAEACIRQMER
ncbi:unnamed protein product, partial [Ectocarpus fasciculatus]